MQVEFTKSELRTMYQALKHLATFDMTTEDEDLLFVKIRSLLESN